MAVRPQIGVRDAYETVRQHLSALLDSYGYDCEVHGDGEAFLNAAGSKAACVLLDVDLPGRNGLDVLAEYIGTAAPIPVIIVTAQSNVAMAVEAMKRGAFDFVEKPYSHTDLIDRIEAARAAAAPDEERAALATKFALLTKRETDVMHGVVRGDANKMIAYRLGLSPKTVEIHRSRVMEKTGANSLSQLVRMAISAGIDPEQGSPEDA